MTTVLPKREPRPAPRPISARTVRWVLFGVAIVTTALVGVLAFFLASLGGGLGTTRDLSSFGSQAEARAFASAHVPTALSEPALVEQLHYEGWTDWNFSARVRFSSPEALDAYLEVVKRVRKLNDSYCTESEPKNGARYFLAEVFACGVIERVSPRVISVSCNTR